MSAAQRRERAVARGIGPTAPAFDHGAHQLQLGDQALAATGLDARDERLDAAGRGADQQIQLGLRKMRQHRFLEVSRKGLRVLHLRADEIARRGRVTASQFLPALLPVDGQELKTGGPAFGELVQQHRIAMLDSAEMGLKETLRFGRREAQVAHVEFEHLGLGAKALQREGHGAARGQHQVQVRRRVVDQPLQRLVDARVAEVVEVVQHQHQVARMRSDGAHQRDQRALDRLAVDATAGEVGGFLRHRWGGLRKAGQQVVEQSRGLVVLGREGERRDVEAQRKQRLTPCDQRGAIAAAGRALQHQAEAAARPIRRASSASRATIRPALRGGTILVVTSALNATASGERAEEVGLAVMGCDAIVSRPARKRLPPATRSG